MSKVAAYLQSHILGEVSTKPSLLNTMSRDASVLTIEPEIVIYPRVTNDIRKVARFAWQLAEKGHSIGITARGSGTDQTGGAIGPGIILSMPAHLNKIYELDSKQKLLRAQPGVLAGSLDQALRLHGLSIPALPASANYSTIGGAVANNASGPLSGAYGAMDQWVDRLEVILANGDVLQTGRISKRELNKKQGVQGMEGDVYRAIDRLIDDNKETIERISTELRDNVGYSGIAQVKRRDGSFDLTPLILGSQGTLGIISEMILKADYISTQIECVAIAFNNRETAVDMADKLAALSPAWLEYYDGELFQRADASGKKHKIIEDVVGEAEAVIMVGFDGFGARARASKLKKAKKLLATIEAVVVTTEDTEIEALMAIRDVTAYSLLPEGKDTSAPPIMQGAYVPNSRFDDFWLAVKEMAKTHHVEVPIKRRVLDDTIYVYPVLQLNKVGDKQKVFKLLADYAKLVDDHGGHLIGEAAEGRVKSSFAYKALDEDVVKLFEEIKKVFDPYGILNPGVKQPQQLKQLVSELRSSYELPAQSTTSLT